MSYERLVGLLVLTDFTDRFYQRLTEDHAEHMQAALDGNQVFIDWFQCMPSVLAWLESLEPLRAVNREQVIEAMINSLEYAEEEERAYQVGEIVGRVSRQYEMMVKRFYPDMYWLALSKRVLYLDL